MPSPSSSPSAAHVQKPSGEEQTLADVLDYAGSNRYIDLRMKRGINLGSTTMVTTIDLGTFLTQSQVGNDPLKGEVTQRKLDMNHARKMGVFIFKGLVSYTMALWKEKGRPIPEEVLAIASYLGEQPYYAWAPIVTSIRDEVRNIRVISVPGVEGELILSLRSNQVIWVVDGQHRRIAWKIVLDYLNQLVRDRKYTKSSGLVPSDLKSISSEETVVFWHEALAYYTERFSITMEVHFGLILDQERQLFHDLNNLQKTVSTSQAQAFDQSNPINIFTHRLREDGLLDGIEIVEDGRVDWNDKAWMRLDALNAVNARLFLNKTSISGAKPSIVSEREEDAWAFWGAVTKIPGIFHRDRSVAAQPAMLKSIARVYFELLWGREPEGKPDAEKFLERLPKIDFSHKNPLWNLPNIKEEELSRYAGLMDHLPDNWREKALVDVVIEDKIHFSSRHNEVILVLPGIIRYLAKLSPKK